MWKREEPTKSESPAANSDAQVPMGSTSHPRRPSDRPLEAEVVNIGKSVIIKGELSGSEDLTIEGKVDGEVELPDHVLTVGPNGRINAQIFAKVVVVMGNVTGNITASEKINIRENGTVEGDIVAPTIAISEGAQFRGSIDMKNHKESQAPETSARASVARTSESLQSKGNSKSTTTSAPATSTAH